jgi:hypothetical protein
MLTGYKVLQGQNIYDLVNTFYNSFDEMYTFIKNNPQIENINFDFEANENTLVYYDKGYISHTPSEIPSQAQKAAPTTATITAIANQNIYDIIAMTYGSFDYAYKLIQDNTLKNIGARVKNVKFTYDLSLVSDDIFYNHIKREKIVIGTGDSTTKTSHDSSFNKFTFN